MVNEIIIHYALLLTYKHILFNFFFFCIDLFLVELEYSLRTNRTTPPIVKALVTNLRTIKPYLLSTNVDVAQPAARLLSCIG